MTPSSALSSVEPAVETTQPADLPWVNILGVRVTATTMAEAVRRIVKLSRMRGPKGASYVCATSVHGVIEATRDPVFRRILNGAALVAADGMPLVWWTRLQGHPGAARVYGPGLVKAVCRATAGTGARHFFYGGARGVADELACRLAKEFPGLEVAGTHCPPFRPLTDAERTDVVGLINDSGADIVWVGLSTPKQERWIDTVRERLEVGVLVSVGAAFDFHTGRIATAPAWMQRAGLEWLFRLVQEPRRLWRRYAVNNPIFLVLAVLQAAGLRRFDADGATAADPTSDRPPTL